MKAVIEFGVSILLMALVTKNLPTILKQIRRGQYIILKEAAVSKWGKPWVPKRMN